MKLRYKLNFLVLGLTILSIVLPSGIYYQLSKEMLRKQVDNYMQAELAQYTYEINGWINTQRQVVLTISDIVNNSYNREDISRDLLQSYIENKSISDIYIGFDNGDFISGTNWVPMPGYDPRNRPWYKEAMEAETITISNIYFDLESQKNTISIAIPLKDKSGTVIGVLSADILLDTFYEKIRNIQLEDRGYALLLDKQGKILVHHDESIIGNLISELENIDMKDLNFEDNQSGVEQYIYKGESKLIVFDEITNTKWRLALVLEEKEAYESLNNLLVIYGVILVATILLATFLTRIFNHNIIERLKLLSDASISLSKGDFNIELEDLGKDEIGEVSKAFDRMKSEIKDKITELDISRAKYKELIENTTDAIYSIDNTGYLIAANTTLLDIFLIDRNSMHNKKFAELIQDSELGGILCIFQEEVIESKELINREIDGIGNHYYNVTLCPILDNKLEMVKGVTVILRDLSDIMQYREELDWISHHDALTKLPNRFKLMEDIDKLILKAKVNRLQFAVVFIDLDDFKIVNDTLGYAMGDSLLQEVAKILQDEYQSYRIGADEFALVVNEYETKEDLYQCANTISKLLNRNYDLGLNTVYNSVTMGVSIFLDDFSDIHEMMIRTDAALNKAKKSGKNAIQFYEYTIIEEMENRAVLEKGLRKALDNNEFLLHYQPIVDHKSQKIKGFEALIRWQPLGGKLISPGVFIPIVENMALIHDIGLWIIGEALATLKNLQETYNENFTMAINLSANQIKLPEFTENVINLIVQSGVEPKYIEFEITETVLIESMELAKKQLQILSDFGAQISLDDFGTGYSSLNYLQHFPIDKLKIDKSFIDYVKYDTAGRSLVKHIISIAHWLNIETIAEGVETMFQKDYLLENECDYFQGFLFFKPMSEKDVKEYLDQGKE